MAMQKCFASQSHTMLRKSSKGKSKVASLANVSVKEIRANIEFYEVMVPFYPPGFTGPFCYFEVFIKVLINFTEGYYRLQYLFETDKALTARQCPQQHIWLLES